MPLEEVPSEEAPLEEVPLEEVPPEEAPLEEEPLEEVPLEEAPLEEEPLEEVPPEEVPPEEAPLEETPLEEAPLEEVPLEKAPLEEVPLMDEPKVMVMGTLAPAASAGAISDTEAHRAEPSGHVECTSTWIGTGEPLRLPTKVEPAGAAPRAKPTPVVRPRAGSAPAVGFWSTKPPEGMPDGSVVVCARASIGKAAKTRLIAAADKRSHICFSRNLLCVSERLILKLYTCTVKCFSTNA